MASPPRSSSCCCSPSPRRRAGCSRWAAATRPSRSSGGPRRRRTRPSSRSVRSRRPSPPSTGSGRSPFFTRQNRKVILLAFAIAVVQPALGDQRDPLLRARHLPVGRRGRQRRGPGERHHRPGQPDRHDGRADRHRQDRAAQADDHRLDRLPGQPGRARGGVLRLRGAVLRLLQRPRAGRARGVHRRARLRPGLGDLGVHLRDLPQPHPRPRPVAGQPDALGVRRRGVGDLPGDRRRRWAAAWRSRCSSSAWSAS